MAGNAKESSSRDAPDRDDGGKGGREARGRPLRWLALNGGSLSILEEDDYKQGLWGRYALVTVYFTIADGTMDNTLHGIKENFSNELDLFSSASKGYWLISADISSLPIRRLTAEQMVGCCSWGSGRGCKWQSGSRCTRPTYHGEAKGGEFRHLFVSRFCRRLATVKAASASLLRLAH